MTETWIITTIKLSPDMYEKAKKNHIKVSEATRIGISMMLAEKGEEQYDNKLNLYRKMLAYQKNLEEALNKLALLEEEKKEFETLTEPGKVYKEQ